MIAPSNDIVSGDLAQKPSIVASCWLVGISDSKLDARSLFSVQAI